MRSGVKLIGVMLVVLGCCGAGGCRVLKMKERIRLLEEMERSITFLLGEMAYSSGNMVWLLEKLSEHKGMLAGFWKDVKDRLMSGQGMPLACHWENAVKDIKISSFHKEERFILLQMGENLGNLDKDTQINMLHIYQEKVREIRKKAVEEYRGKAKVTMVSGVTAGFFLGVYLL